MRAAQSEKGHRGQRTSLFFSQSAFGSSAGLIAKAGRYNARNITNTVIEWKMCDREFRGETNEGAF